MAIWAFWIKSGWLFKQYGYQTNSSLEFVSYLHHPIIKWWHCIPSWIVLTIHSANIMHSKMSQEIWMRLRACLFGHVCTKRWGINIREQQSCKVLKMFEIWNWLTFFLFGVQSTVFLVFLKFKVPHLNLKKKKVSLRDTVVLLHSINWWVIRLDNSR